MPKLFPISIEVEELAVGKVMRLLNKTPGVAKFNLDFDKEAKTNGAHEPGETQLGAPRGPRGPYKIKGSPFEKTGDEVILKSIYDQPQREPISTDSLRTIFVKDGRSPKSIHSQLHKLKKIGDIKNTPDGWILTKKARDRLRNRVSNKKRA